MQSIFYVPQKGWSPRNMLGVWVSCQGDFPQETSATVTAPLTPKLSCLLLLGCSPSVVDTGGQTELPTGVNIPILFEKRESGPSFISRAPKISRMTELERG